MMWEIFGGMSSFAEHQRIIHSTVEMLRINAQLVKKNSAWGTPAHRRIPRPWKCKFHMHALPKGVPVYPGSYKPWKIFPFGRSTRTRLKQGNTKASHQAQESISLFFADSIHPQRFFSDWCNPCYFTTAISIQFMSRTLRLILLCLFKKREVYYHPGLCFVSAWVKN